MDGNMDGDTETEKGTEKGKWTEKGTEKKGNGRKMTETDEQKWRKRNFERQKKG